VLLGFSQLFCVFYLLVIASSYLSLSSLFFTITINMTVIGNPIDNPITKKVVKAKLISITVSKLFLEYKQFQANC